jgi:Putative zinc-finger
MIGCDLQAAGTIDLYFYEELDAVGRREVEAHLASCAECRGALDELRTIRAALAEHQAVAAPPHGDWTRLMARIETAVTAERGPGGAAAVRAAGARRRPVPAYLAMAALVVLVAASLAYVARSPRAATAVAGPVARLAPSTGSGEEGTGRGAGTSAAEKRPDAAFAAVSEQHFERSKLVILGLASRNAATASSSDWAYERHLAGALLDDTRLYKQAAEARGLESLAGVMSDLELVLLQASLSADQDAETLDRLQRLIRKRDLVSKMEMTGF